MENHGLGHLPQPDNFTTIGNNLGIEINQYNCPINVMRFTTELLLTQIFMSLQAYSEHSIDEMRSQKERGGLENMDMMARLPQEPKDRTKFDPAKSNAIQAVRLEESQGQGRST